MKKSLLLVAAFFVVFNVFSQNPVFWENFDTIPYGSHVTSSSTGTASWGISNNLYVSGTRSDSCPITQGDTTYLTTDAFSTIGKWSVLLNFSHICKIEYFDVAEIEVSNNNGTTWTKLTGTQYLGTGNFGNIGNKFTSSSYVPWLPVNNNAIPTNAWWKAEQFDISALVSNSAQVKIRFVLADANNTGSTGNYGWLIDDIIVLGSLAELIPPTIVDNSAIPDTIFSTGPYTISAEITDTSGIDTAYVVYTVNGINPDTIPMVNTTLNNYEATIPSFTYNNTICYYIVAIDSSLSYNVGQQPSTGCTSFLIQQGSSIVTVGTGTITNSISGYPAPYGNIFWGARHQMLITAAELQAAGMGGGQILSLGFDVANVNTCPGLNNFTIKMGNTSLDSLTTSYVSGLSQVYTNSSYKPVVGWNTHAFQTSFTWNGSSNIIIETCFNNTSSLQNASMKQSSTSYPSTLWYPGNITSVCGYSSGFPANQRPNMQIGMAITNFNYDVGISSIIQPSGIVLANQNLPIEVEVRNLGVNTLTKATIKWSLDDTLQTPAYTWTGTLYQAMAAPPIVFDSVSMLPGAHTLKVWGESPNDSTDQNNYNDTASVSLFACLSILNGTYTIGGATADFQSFNDALYTMNNAGINGPVIFNVNAGTYNEQLNIALINGISATNTVTFQSASGNNTDVVIQYAASATNTGVVHLNGADYLRFKNLTIKAIGATYACGVFLTGAEHNIFEGNIIQTTVSTSSNSRGVVLLYLGALNQYNTFTNNVIKNGFYGIYCCCSVSAASPAKGNVFEGNEINNVYNYSTYFLYQDSLQFVGNSIDNANNSGSVYGFYSYFCDNIKVIGNNINIHGTGMHYGIRISYADALAVNPSLIANNFVSLTGTGGSTWYGTYLENCTNVNIYHNSFHIIGGSATSGAFFQYSGINQNYKNNIFSNTGSGYAAYFYTPTVISSSDYNDFYATGSNFVYWSGIKANLSALQSASGKDANSKSVNPQFNSNTDLHISLGALDSAGTPIPSVTIDIDGQTRDTLTPDIGADEFAILPNDAGIFALVSPVAPCPGDTSDIIVKLRNFGTDTLFTAIINWAVNDTLQTSFNFNGTILVGQMTNINIGQYVFLQGINNKLEIWSSNPNGPADGNPLNDSLVIQPYETSLPFGTFTIGPDANDDYPSFSAAISDLNAFGICGPVVFDIDSGIYNEQITLTEILGTSSTNTITFKSASGVKTDVVLTCSSGAVLSLDGADYIIFKNISIVGTASAYHAVQIANGAMHNTFEGNILQVAGTTSYSYRTIYDYTTLNHYNTYRNNLIKGGYFGMYIYGVGSSSRQKGTVIEGNEVKDFNLYGMSLSYQDSVQVIGNYIHDGINSYQYGIYINYLFDGFRIEKNRVILSPSSYAYGIRINSCNYYYYINASTAEGIVANNFISISTGSSTNYGLYAYNSNKVKYYFNSVNISGGSTSSRALYQYNVTQNTFKEDYVNNIFVCTSGGYAAYFNTPASVMTIDYNDYYTTGTYLAYWSGNITTLSALKSASGKDAHSISADPVFLTNTDLHAISPIVDGMGTPLSLVQFDIDGEPRDSLTPDIGADEFFPSPYDLGVITILSPISGCGLDTNETVSVLIKNYGSAPIYGSLTVGYNWPGLASPVIESLTDTILPGDTLLHIFSIAANLDLSAIGHDSIFNIKAWAQYPGDNFNGNDTLLKNVNSNYLPPVPVTAPVTITYGTQTNISATSANLLYWYANDSMTVTLGVGPTYQTPILYDTTTYWVNANTNSCASARIPLTVNIINFPTIDAGVSNIFWPNTGISSGTSQVLQVEVANYGTSPLTSAEVHWTMNGQHDSIQWTGSILNGQVDTVNIDTTIFNWGIYNFQAWTSMPNNIADTINSNDTSAVVTFNACLLGTYTIGDTTGAAVYDFPSFNAAKNALATAGVCGNVTFLVDTGTYEERVTFPDVMGVGPNARITFTSMSGDSTGVILHYTLSSSAAWTMKVSGDYYTFSHMTLSSVGSTNFGRVMEITNAASHNEFLNCVIEGVVTTSTSSNYSLVYCNGGNMEYNTFKNNRMLNGTYPLYFYGASTNLQKGNVFEGNSIENFYYYGPYFYYQDSLQFNNNYIENDSGPAVYGVRFDNSDYIKVTKNHIIIHGTNYYHYGMYFYFCDANAANPNIVANNFITLNGIGIDTWNGMYLHGSTRTNLYYNSINLTGGSTTSRCIYQGSGSNNKLVNNILSNTGGGYSLYVASPNTLIICDYNSLYSSGTNLAYWSGAKANLSALQSASGKDVHSISVLPPFMSATDLHIATTTLSTLGTSLTEVTDDIDGVARSSMPTIGADEVPIIPFDAGVSSIIVPTANSILNEAASQAVSVIVTNFGTDTIFGMNVQYSVNNGTPVSVAYSDTLILFATDTILMPNFTVPAGNSNICVKTVLTGDTNYFNDEYCNLFFGAPTKDAYLTRIIDINEGCGLGLDTVKIWIYNVGVDTINGNTATTITAKYKIDTAPVVSENMTLAINPGDSALFKFNALANFAVTTIDSVFDIVAWVDLTGDNVSYNDTAYTDVESLHTPANPLVTNITIPYGTPVTLTAVSPTNDSLYWYNDSIGGSEIYCGTNFITPFINYTDTTFWVQAGRLVPMALYTLGTGTATNTSNTYPTPYGSRHYGNKNHFLARASELTAMGMSAGEIQSVAFNVASVNSCPALTNFEVKIKNTSTTSLSTTWESGLTSVYTNSSHQPVVGWNTYNFTTPFVWDGSSNIIVETCFNNSSWVNNGNASVRQTYTNYTSTHEYHAYNSTVCSSPSSGSIKSKRPNMKFFAGGGGGCTSNRVPIDIIVSAQKACDVGALSLVEPASSIYLSASEPVKVLVKNYGTVAQTNIPVSYQLNNGAIITDTITSTILPSGSYTHTFGTRANFSIPGNSYSFKAYTSYSCDSVQVNDTIWSTVQNLIPNYCPSAATITLFHDIENVTFGAINNTSPMPFNKLYTDYTSVPPAMIAPSNTYPISIKINSLTTNSYPGYVEVYIDYNRNGAYEEATETAFGTAYSSVSPSNPVTVTGNIVVSSGALTGLSQMRVVAEIGTNSAAVHPCGTYSYGETEDYSVIIAPKLHQDAAIVDILQPTTIAASAITPIEVIIVNYGIDIIDSIDVSYQINSATPVKVTLTDTILPLDSMYYTFPTIALPTGQNTICAYTTLVGDSNIFNDQHCITSFVQLMTTPPYSDNFEGVDCWLADTLANQWQRGTPNAQTITSAHSPNNAWMIQLDTNYNNNSFDFLYTPKFVFGLISPDSLSFWHYYHTQSMYDGGRIQYLNNTGFWSTLGVKNDVNGTNWYNTTQPNSDMWTGNSGGWQKSTYDLSSVNDLANIAQFRLIFSSNDTTNNFDGWAIDDFKITVPKLPIDAGITNIITPVDSTMTGSNVTVQITIQNFGTDTLTTIPVNYAVTGQAATTETWTGSLLPNTTDNYTFTAPYQGPNALYKLCAWTSLTADTHFDNDSTCKNISTIAAADDVGIIEIINPDSITAIGYNITVIAKIQNFGTNTITSIPVEYEYGINLIQATWTGTLLPNATEDYTFTTTYPSPIGSYNLCVRTNLAGDADITNDEICEGLIGTIGIDEYDNSKFILLQNVPNPTKGITTIGYIVPKTGKIIFEVINLLGKTIYSENNNVLAGKHQIDLDVNNLPAGIYYYSLIFDGKRLVKKMIKN